MNNDEVLFAAIGDVIQEELKQINTQPQFISMFEAFDSVSSKYEVFINELNRLGDEELIQLFQCCETDNNQEFNNQLVKLSSHALEATAALVRLLATLLKAHEVKTTMIHEEESRL